MAGLLFKMMIWLLKSHLISKIKFYRTKMNELSVIGNLNQ